LGLLALGRFLSPALSIGLDRILPALDLLADHALDQAIVAGPTRAGLFGRSHHLALEERKRVQRKLVSAPARVDELRLKPIVESHGGDCHTCTDRGPITDNRPL